MRFIFIVCIVLVSIVSYVRPALLQMELTLGEERCVGHELDEDDEATFKVAATSKSTEVDKQNVIVTITDPDDGRVLYEKLPVGSKKITSRPLEVKSRGVYEMCFSTTGLTDGTFSTYLDVRFYPKEFVIKSCHHLIHHPFHRQLACIVQTKRQSAYTLGSIRGTRRRGRRWILRNG